MKRLAVAPGETPVGDLQEALVRAAFLRWEPGESCGLHFHPGAGELFVFIVGECEVEVEGEVMRCGAGDCVYVEPDERHRLAVAGEEPCSFFLAVFPNRSPRTVWVREGGKLEEEL
jgi:quercetin dioxygenase-like cupin family protein